MHAIHRKIGSTVLPSNLLHQIKTYSQIHKAIRSVASKFEDDIKLTFLSCFKTKTIFRSGAFKLEDAGWEDIQTKYPSRFPKLYLSCISFVFLENEAQRHCG